MLSRCARRRSRLPWRRECSVVSIARTGQNCTYQRSEESHQAYLYEGAALNYPAFPLVGLPLQRSALSEHWYWDSVLFSFIFAISPSFTSSLLCEPFALHNSPFSFAMARLALATPLLFFALLVAFATEGLAGPACTRRNQGNSSCPSTCKKRWGYPGRVMGTDPWGQVMTVTVTDMGTVLTKACRVRPT